jgi:hypothetical protein
VRTFIIGAALCAAVGAAAQPAKNTTTTEPPRAAETTEPRTTISWEEADKHVGEDVTVEGRILGVHCSPLACLLAFEPTFNKFTAVVQAANFDKLPPDDLDQRFSGKQVRVQGRIVEREGKPEIIVEDADKIALRDAPKRREREREQTARQAEVLERIADVLERIEELTERMVDVQERMELMLVNLEERNAEVADVVAQAAQPPPPLPSGDGDPQPRPGYETLRSIKRGMSRADVERLVGPPQYVERGGGGWVTYYYGFGRSVSFDRRGKAAGFVGFEQ